MAPSFNEGDWLLFYTGPGRWRGNSRSDKSLIGKVVLIRQSPELQIVKRVLKVNRENSGAKKYWVEGDNKSASTDSRTWGEISNENIVGVLLMRYRRGSN